MNPHQEQFFYDRYPCPACGESPVIEGRLIRWATRSLPGYPVISIKFGSHSVCSSGGWPISPERLGVRDFTLEERWNEQRKEWAHPKFTLKCLKKKEGCLSHGLPSTTNTRGLREYWLYRFKDATIKIEETK